VRSRWPVAVSAILALTCISPAQAVGISKGVDTNAITACTELKVAADVVAKVITLTKGKSQINPLALASVNTFIGLAQTPLKAALASTPALKTILPNIATIQRYATTGKLNSAVLAALKNLTSVCANTLKK